MSGGYFDYYQFKMQDIKSEIDDLISNNDNEELNDFGYTTGRFYNKEVIDKFKEAAILVEAALEAIHRVDWLVSADDGEETFLEGWEEKVTPLILKIRDL